MKIIILGNGFDLSSGLPTKYSDFFSHRMQEIQAVLDNFEKINNMTIESNSINDFQKYKKEKNVHYIGYIDIKRHDEENKIFLEKCINRDFGNVKQQLKNIVSNFVDNDITFWDIFFYLDSKNILSKELQWHDIENKINQYLNNGSHPKCLYSDNINKSNEQSIERDMKNFFLNYEKEYYKNIIAQVNNDKLFGLFIFYLLEKRYPLVKNIGIHECLLLELESFEQHFQFYITKILNRINDDKPYQRIYRNNLQTLINDSQGGEYLLLNFNYTKFTNVDTNRKFNFRRNNTEYSVHESNVHGDCDTITIFGIDQSGFSASEPQYIFTKTYRKMKEQNKIKEFFLPEINDIKEIIIYGHSLSDADSSYFQSIFDYYDIYHNKVLLNFKYSYYGEKDEWPHIKGNYLKATSKLIEKYGETMDNVNHGKNLLHKLLLENRLKITRIKLQEIPM